MLRRRWLAILAGAWLGPASAGAVSLVVDSLGASSVVNAGDSVSFSFALRFDPGETLLATQAEITAPQLSDFSLERARSPWDLAATFRLRGDNPMWVYAENAYGEDAPGVTYDEVGGLAPLGRLSAIATYNGEIEFLLNDWVLSLLDGTAIPLDPAWAQIRTGITVVGGADLPPVPPPPAPAPTPAAPVVEPMPVVAPPADLPVPYSSSPTIVRRLDRPGTRIFYPATEDADPRVPCESAEGCGGWVAYRSLDGPRPVLHGTNSYTEGATPEPSAFVLMLIGASATALARRRQRELPKA